MEFGVHAPRSVQDAFLVAMPAQSISSSPLDTFETFFDARFDLWERRLKKHSRRAREALRMRGLDRDIDREIAKLKDTVRVLLPALGTPVDTTADGRCSSQFAFKP